jgi:hypothetical protein
VVAVLVVTMSPMSACTSSRTDPASVGMTAEGTAVAVDPATDTYLPPRKPYVAPAPETITSRAQNGLLRMHEGEVRHILLSFKGFGPGDNFRPFDVSRTQVIAVNQGGGYPGTAPVSADVTAVRPGAAKLVAHSDAHCFYYKEPCGFPEFAWTLRVLVTK